MPTVRGTRHLVCGRLQRGGRLVGDRPGTAGPRHVTHLGDPVLDDGGNRRSRSAGSALRTALGCCRQRCRTAPRSSPGSGPRSEPRPQENRSARQCGLADDGERVGSHGRATPLLEGVDTPFTVQRHCAAQAPRRRIRVGAHRRDLAAVGDRPGRRAVGSRHGYLVAEDAHGSRGMSTRGPSGRRPAGFPVLPARLVEDGCRQDHPLVSGLE